ncbi:MAG: VOC family protein [Betaproteobacteria bacterium]|nr:VOC family protein [Betaproteobacteria bacterium]
MIGYTTFGTNNLAAATQFFDGVFGVIGAKRYMEFDRGVAWSVGLGQPGFGIMKPYDGQPATVGNGGMVAIIVDSRDKVDAIYNKAIELGGSDEGPPGQRFPNFYAAYFRDLDGNKFNAYYMGP